MKKGQFDSVAKFALYAALALGVGVIIYLMMHRLLG